MPTRREVLAGAALAGLARPQDLDWTIERLESELAFRDAAGGDLAFPEPGIDEAQRHLLPFVLRNEPRYQAGWFHVLVCEVLERFVWDIEARRSPRLILTTPPRHGKSTLVSQNLPDWFLGRNPDKEVVVSSYGQDLADKMSKAARRNRANSLDVFPGLAPYPKGSDGVQFWEVSEGGSYNAVGVGGPLTGHGFHMGIVDDPIKNAQQAASEVERQAIKDWYQSTFWTRAAPGAGILVMATRWHTDDLIGWLLSEEAKGTGERWQVINFPAIAEEDEYHPYRPERLLRREGEALHPARYDEEWAARAQKAVGARVWGALYQCRPTDDKGGTFERGWYRTIHEWDPFLPPFEFEEVAVTIDANFNDSKSSARACISVWGRKGSRRVRLHEECERFTYVKLREAAIRIGHLFHPSFFLIELAANGYALLDDLQEMGWTVIGFKPSQFGAKPLRAELAARDHEAGNVELVAADWNGAWIEEHVAFPHGKFKDRVDADAQLMIYWRDQHRVMDQDEETVEANKLLSSIMHGLPG